VEEALAYLSPLTSHFHGLIEFVGSHANFALIVVFLLALSREVMTKKNPAGSRIRAASRCFESDQKLLSDRCLGFDIPLEPAMSRPIAAKDEPEGTFAQSLCCSGDRDRRRAAARRHLARRDRRRETN
jgi:hypothetical protein